MTYPQQVLYAACLLLVAPLVVPLLCAGVVLAYIAIILALVFNVSQIRLT